MSVMDWRPQILERLGWSLGLASLWVWGLLLIRMLRDGLLPLEVWFGYSLSFFMTSVYVYMGLLIYATFRAESRSAGDDERKDPTPSTWRLRLARWRRPVSLLGLVGLGIAVVALVAWLALRYPGPQAIPGTYGSIMLALMILALVVISTLLARGARR